MATMSGTDQSREAPVAAPDGMSAEFERLRGKLGLASGPAPRIEGRYQIHRTLGRGAMGEVHLAHDHRLGRTVALKVVRTNGAVDTATLRTRLEREALALARVDHPNVVHIFDVGSHDGQTYLTMQYIAGTTLRSWQAGRSHGEILGSYLQAARGLAAAHAVGVVHRDFKPDNTLVGDDGIARVLDFGIAAAIRSDDLAPPEDDGVAGDVGETHDTEGQAITASEPRDLPTMTRPGALLGTLPYMASEQLAGRRADARSDQFAFCVALWEALTGRRPFAGRSPDALRRGIAAGPDVGDLAPRWLRAILARGLADDPRRRWPDMPALIEAIERAARRRRLWRIVVALVAVAAVVVAASRLYGVLADAAAEARADARLDALRGQLTALKARGDDAGAAQQLRNFVEFPDNRGSAALARAYREWGEAQSDHAAAVDAYASAYVAARSPADGSMALRGLIERLHAGGALQESAAALAVLSREDPAAHADPALARPRLAAALHRRDIAAATAVLASGPASERAWIPVLEDLSHVTIHGRERLGLDRQRLSVLATADLDGDGRAEIVSNGYGPDRDVAIVLRAEPALSEWGRVRWPVPLEALMPLPHALTGAPMLMSSHLVGSRYQLRLSRVVDGSPELVAAWDEGESRWFGGLSVDLDGDGALELYLGSGPYARRLSRFDRGPEGWTRRVANRATDATRSDMLVFAAGDLDDDGRGELVVAPGPWTAYDLRVLRARPGAGPGVDDSLELVARRSFGAIGQVVLPRTRGGRRIAFIKDDSYPAPGRFPADRQAGEPPGLYVVELRGDAIEVVEHVPLPPSWGTPRCFERILAGDLDGDGEDELVGSLCGGAGMALMRWHEGRLLPPLVLTRLAPALVYDLDGDGRDEIVASDALDPDRVVVFGAGDEALAAVSVTERVHRIPDGIADRAIADAWRRAEELAEIGVPGRAADELVVLARLTGEVAEEMLLRASELYEATGADALAADHYVAAAARPSLADRALAGAIRSRRRLGEFAGAAALVERRLPGLAGAERAAAEAELAVLRRATAPRPASRWDFAEALDPMWRIDDPLAVRRDLERRALAVWPTRSPVAAEYPLEWDGGPLTLAVDLEVDRLEASHEVRVGIAGPDDEPAWISLRVAAQGSSAAPQLSVQLVLAGRSVSELAVVEAGARLRARVTVVPELASVIEEIEVDGRSERKIYPLAAGEAGPPAGPMRLVLGGAEGLWTEFTGRVWLREIRLSGVTAGARMDFGSPAARMLAELDFAGAAEALRDRVAGPELLWRAEALAGLGRLDEAAALLADVPEDSPEFAALTHRLRRDRDAFTLAARAGLGSRWIDVVGRGGGRPRPVDDLAALTDWPSLRGPPPADASPQERARHGWALALRGRAQVGFGHLDEAGRDLADAAATLAGDGQALPDREVLLEMVAEAQLRLAAARGDRVALREALARLLARSPIPAIRLEMVMNDPQIRAQLGAEEWAALQREHRP
jgi:hypothetical protein